MSYLAEFIKHINGEENKFHKCVKLDFNFDHTNDKVHNSLIQNLDDEQLEGSGFQFQEKEELSLEIYKTNDIHASSYIECQINIGMINQL